MYANTSIIALTINKIFAATKEIKNENVNGQIYRSIYGKYMEKLYK